MKGGRGAYRYGVDLPAWLVVPGGATVAARVKNLSGTGIAVRVDLPLDADGEAAVHLPSAGTRLRVIVGDQRQGQPIARQWSGQVVHGRSGVGGGQFGIAFDWPEGAGALGREACLARPVVAWPIGDARGSDRPIRLSRVAGIVGVLGVLADQLSKVLAGWCAVSAGSKPLMLLAGSLAVVPVVNTGMVASLASNLAATGPLCALLALILLVLALRSEWRRGAMRLNVGTALAGGLLVAGLLGNSIDRLALGHVRDFLVSPAFPYWAFNLADLFLVAGGVILVAATRGSAGGRRPWTSQRPA